MKSRPSNYGGIPAVAAIVMTCGDLQGQTSKFTHQGKLSDAGVAAMTQIKMTPEVFFKTGWLTQNS